MSGRIQNRSLEVMDPIYGESVNLTIQRSVFEGEGSASNLCQMGCRFYQARFERFDEIGPSGYGSENSTGSAPQFL